MNLKATAKFWVKKAAVESRALRLAAQVIRPSAVILMYHAIEDHPEEYANSIGLGIIHATAVFTRHMELVARRFTPVTIDDVWLFLSGRASLPRRAVAVTFDDGYRDNSETAAPILERLGIPGAFYLTTDFIGSRQAPWFCRLRHAFAATRRAAWTHPATGRPYQLSGSAARQTALLAAFDFCAPLAGDRQQHAVGGIEQDLDVEPLQIDGLMMSWDDARNLARRGHIVGCHTRSHPNLAYVGDGCLHGELIESKLKLERELGAPVAHFSYPHPALIPQWSERTLAVTRQAGYATAVLTTGGPVRSGQDPLLLTRIRAPYSETEFLWNLESSFLGHRV